jgi:hypothetical protein
MGNDIDEVQFMVVVLLFIFGILWLKYSLWTAVGILCAGLAALGLVIYLAGLAETHATDAPRRKRPKDRGFDVAAHLRITYQDRNDERTTRDIVAKQYLDHSPGEIYAYCKLRRAHRTFVTSRIEQAIDLDTGEVVKRLPTYFREHRTNAAPPA